MCLPVNHTCQSITVGYGSVFLWYCWCTCFVVEVVTYVAVLLIKGEIVLENMSEIFTNPLPSAYLCLYCMEILCKYTVC